jgi:hypothetical protein
MPISATVNSTSGGVNEGSVTFTVLNNNGTALGSAQAPVVNGQASTTLILPSLAAGTYTIAENYHDSEGNFSDSSGNGKLTVNPAPTTINVFNITITITSSSVKISVTITSTNGVINEGIATSTLDVLGIPVASASAPVVSDEATYTLSLPKLIGSLAKTNSVLEVGPKGLLSPSIFNITETYQDSSGNFSNSSTSSNQLTVNSSSISTILKPGNATAVFSPTGLIAPISATVTSSNGAVNQGAVTFTVLNNGTAMDSIQATVVNGQAAALLDLPSLAAGNYTITESYHDINGGFSDSGNTGQLTINAAPVSPVITVNPTSQTVMVGSNVSFTAAASGTPTPTVQWQVSTDGGKTFTNISDATSTTLTLNNVTTAMNGYQYQAVFTNVAGSITSSAATLTVNAPPPPPAPPPAPSAPPTLNTPPLLSFFDSLLAATETVNADGSVTETASFFGIPLLVSTFDSSGHLESVFMFGINVTLLFELL